MKLRIKRLLAFTLVAILLVNINTSFAMSATEEDINQYPYTLFASSNEEGAITVKANNSCINGNVATNGTINGFMNVNGKKIENANVDMIYIFDKIESKYFANNNIDEHTTNYTLEDLNIK